MNKSDFSLRHRWSLLMAAALVFSGGAMAQDDDRFKDVKIETVKVADGIYMLMGQGGNIGLSVGADGAFLIDDQFAPLTDKIEAAVAAVSQTPVRFVINTHWHGDHTGGNENLGKAGAVIVAHDNVYERMSVETFSKMWDRTIPASPKAALPVITFNDRATFHINGGHIKAVHYPHAHTDGDSVLFFESANVVHTGDIFFHGLYPFIDVESGGSIKGVIKAAEHLLTLVDDKTKIMPGHGPLTDRKGLQEYVTMLKTVRDRVQKLVDQGKTLEEIQAMKPNAADYDKTLGTGYFNPDAFLRILYMNLTAPQ